MSRIGFDLNNKDGGRECPCFVLTCSLQEIESFTVEIRPSTSPDFVTLNGTEKRQRI